ncbi:fimbrial protein [Cedecea davisae]|nr:fimbrial protein [Cedecea davisae]
MSNIDMHKTEKSRAVRQKNGVISPRGLAAALMFACAASFHASASLPDNWEVEGAHGELAVEGRLLEGACSLDMKSIWQDVELGTVSTAGLIHPGDTGEPTHFTVVLHDCIRMRGNEQDWQTDEHTWDPFQPVLTLSFDAGHVSHSDLIQVAGLDGIGLRISDVKHHDIELGHRISPQFLSVGDNTLEFTITPERTSAPLLTGHFRAVVNFQLSYD